MKVSQNQNTLPETNIALYVNYLNFKLKKKKTFPPLILTHLMKYLNVTIHVIPRSFVNEDR